MHASHGSLIHQGSALSRTNNTHLSRRPRRGSLGLGFDLRAALVTWLLLMGVAAPIAAQTSHSGSAIAVGSRAPWVDLEGSLRPHIEHLITRGVIQDPSPMVRPWAREALIAAILGAEEPSHAADRSRLELVRQVMDLQAEERWDLALAGGATAWSSGRRELLQPEGAGGIGALARVDGSAYTGALSLVGAAVADARLQEDPDWPGRAIAGSKAMSFRVPLAYADVRVGKANITIGTMPRHWGIIGGPGLALSERAYPRPGMGLQLRSRHFTWEGVVLPLPPGIREDGVLAERTLAAHRLRWAPSSRLDITIWETMVMARPGVSSGEVLERTLVFMTFAGQFGRRSDNNTILGVQGAWRPVPGLHLEAQVAGDDIRAGRPNLDRGETDRPDRWAAAAGMRGAGPMGTTWALRYERITAQAYRTKEPQENFLADGVGIVEPVPDYDRATLALGVPLGTRWLISPRLQLQRQGEGRLTAPTDFTETGPTFLAGEVRRTLWLGSALEGTLGGLRVRGDVGMARETIVGWEPRGRIELTWGRGTGGAL